MRHIMLVNAVHKEQMRMATVDEKGKLIEFNIQMAVREPITGNIYKGKVLKVERGLQAAFVDYGGVKDGFLPLRDVSHEYMTEQEPGTSCGKSVLKPGQEIIVQVVREVIGNKGALLTSYISLPGRYVVLLPNKLCGGISRKIESEEDRQKIKNLMEQIKVPEDMGFIVRTAGINRTKQEIQRDYQFLMRLWKEIQKKAESVAAPFFLYQETDFGVRSLRDYLTQEIDEIQVDDLETFRKMRAYLKAVAPRHLRMLKNYKEKVPIFERFDLEEQIRVIYQERVELKSGGYIIINPTEAMITIDVNSGRGSNKRNIEETAFKTNVDACDEIARQLRLRDLGGLIVIDFIDMIDKKHIADVEKAFKKALSVDRARIQLSRISKFGLLELSRQKKQSTIQEISYIKCPHCKGTGLRPSLEYASLGAFRKIESEAVKGIYSELKVCLPHEIALYILNNKRSELLKLEASFGVCLHIEGMPDMAWDKLEIQQCIKEQTLEASVIQETLAQSSDEEEGSPAESKDPGTLSETENAGSEEVPKKKSRRRHRRKKGKGPEVQTDGAAPENPDTPLPENRNTPTPAASSARSPYFPVKPLKIMRALPEEFFPVELGGDVFAPDSEKDDDSDQSDD
ncbi:MAG TPA: Rne/Rng family ribonuclease [Smithellaceae bacterium]|jgi:ribonuclease E|nr:Rne/Rng family ribonuclease [Smithellaceae bacterium]HQM44566.1 Rne/Rng family ribonuclease [Smithellaceae bacterium]